MNTNDNRLKAHKLIDHIFQDLLPAHGMAQRPEQIQLSHRMLDAMQDGRIALCDAGTGIGKTYAYLAAATAASAFPTGQIARPIIISTSSIALQNAVLTEYLHTGLVPRLPTFVAACFMALFSLQSFICGLILDTQGKMHRQNFELQMTILSGMYHAAQTTDNEKAE